MYKNIISTISIFILTLLSVLFLATDVSAQIYATDYDGNLYRARDEYYPDTSGIATDLYRYESGTREGHGSSSADQQFDYYSTKGDEAYGEYYVPDHYVVGDDYYGMIYRPVDYDVERDGYGGVGIVQYDPYNRDGYGTYRVAEYYPVNRHGYGTSYAGRDYPLNRDGYGATYAGRYYPLNRDGYGTGQNHAGIAGASFNRDGYGSGSAQSGLTGPYVKVGGTCYSGSGKCFKNGIEYYVGYGYGDYYGHSGYDYRVSRIYREGANEPHSYYSIQRQRQRRQDPSENRGWYPKKP